MNGRKLKSCDIKSKELGSIESIESVHICEESVMEMVEKMTVEDKKLLRSTWLIVGKNMKDIGGKIFHMIFEQSPDTKTLFPFTKSYGNKNDKVNNDIQFHGLRFMQIIESAIKNIDHISDLEPILDNLGRRHGKLIEKTAFKTHHWATFVECTLFHFRNLISRDSSFALKIAKIDEAIILWRILLRCIIKRMKVGLAQDLKNRKNHRQYNCNTNLNNSNVSLQSKNSPSLKNSKSSITSGENNSIM